MATGSFPAKDKLTIGFAHAAYQLGARFALRNSGINAFEVRNFAGLEARIGEADVLVVSGRWQNTLLAKAPRLRFLQSISAGVNQYDQALFCAQGVRLASAQGVNEVAVAEHAMALMLGLRRHQHTARDNQRAKHWRPMIADIPAREDELAGKTLVIVGYGRIGKRLAKLAKAFDMRVIGLRRSTGGASAPADEVRTMAEFSSLLPVADVVALTCPLTPETTGLIGAAALGAMKRSALLINVARGPVVNEAALIEALQKGAIGGAGIDVTVEEPLPVESALWGCGNALITPHTAGETQAYEDNVLDILMENLDRLWRGEASLRNEIV